MAYGRIFAAALFSLLTRQVHALPPLQLFVELTPEGGVLRPTPGDYAGPVVLKRRITLDGQGQVTVDGGGEGTVIRVEADGAVVRGLRVTNSGESHNDLDAGILVAASDVVVEDNTIDDTLFGIHLRNADACRVADNRIRSKPREATFRGEGIRLWYSHDNLIEGNSITAVRDLVFSNSRGNVIRRNTIRDSRVGMEFVFSPDNQVSDNRISGNSSGIVVLYSNDLEISGNHLSHMRGYSGTGFALKESAGVNLAGNTVLHCTVGVGANAPTHPENIYRLTGNRFAYNNIALYFYGEKGGHILHGNRFEQNHVDVAVSAPTTAVANAWDGNYWDRYAGFDRDGDGRGDIPYDLYHYADRLWMDRPMSGFFRGSPMLELVDLVERLAPLSSPRRVLQDPAPLLRPPD